MKGLFRYRSKGLCLVISLFLASCFFIFSRHFNRISASTGHPVYHHHYDGYSDIKGGWTVMQGGVVVHSGTTKTNHSFNFTLNNEDKICSNFERGGNKKKIPKFLILVASDVRNNLRRRAIRDTWGHVFLQRAHNFRIAFLLGASRTSDTQKMVTEEMFEHGDLVQGDFNEYFKNLALKTVMGMTWANIYCDVADYVMKTDDDIFVHVPNLVAAVVTSSREQLMRGKSNNFLICHKNRARHIIRKGHRMAKYHVNWSNLPGKFFPEYCGGFGYVMPRDALKILLKGTSLTPEFFIEDVYVTGFCRHKMGVGLLDHPAFQLNPPVLNSNVGCVFGDGRVTSHELQLHQVREIWSKLNSQGFFCPQLLVTNNKTDSK